MSNRSRLCRAFNETRGFCKRGTSCRFIHTLAKCPLFASPAGCIDPNCIWVHSKDVSLPYPGGPDGYTRTPPTIKTCSRHGCKQLCTGQTCHVCREFKSKKPSVDSKDESVIEQQIRIMTAGLSALHKLSPLKVEEALAHWLHDHPINPERVGGMTR